ncbi:Rho termination factor N-terminal domain-containing protein [Halorubrum sp. SD612]|uniref:Rho termination factor N-terminal domain-containing protein n=1 Tax=Halorubrum sp. SD612 TaxID=1855863 RepID=UPI000A2D93B9|nr:Rho termination factor N-terminal domain-containing protein [Halorubrum sp. SD612]OTF12987.1 hypothetical protein B9G38_01650 [Halorubrum sp. SD612]
MPSIDITDDQRDRIAALREALTDAHADRYTSVTLPDTVAYLLDLADAVDDPDRRAAVDTNRSEADDDDGGFPRERLEARLRERNRRHSDANPDDPMDLYSIAAEYDVSGRSSMTKGELVTAILDVAERRYTAPFAPVDVELPDADHDGGSGADTDSAEGGSEADHDDDDGSPEADHDNAEDGGDESDTAAESDADDQAGDDGQLNAMLSLLETHSDKWDSADGDARYEVELPDGSVETARTKDDVRAALFKHY